MVKKKHRRNIGGCIGTGRFTIELTPGKQWILRKT